MVNNSEARTNRVIMIDYVIISVETGEVFYLSDNNMIVTAGTRDMAVSVESFIPEYMDKINTAKEFSVVRDHEGNYFLKLDITEVRMGVNSYHYHEIGQIAAASQGIEVPNEHSGLDGNVIYISIIIFLLLVIGFLFVSKKKKPKEG